MEVFYAATSGKSLAFSRRFGENAAMRTFEWAIEDIVEAYPGLELQDFAAMVVVLMACLDSPGEFLVQIDGFEIAELDADMQFLLRVSWGEATEARANRIERTIQRNSIVEGAAIALTTLLFSHFIADSELAVTDHGDGADYWLRRRRQALEISGTERPREIRQRVRKKQKQMLANWYGWDGYAVVCCFAPTHRVIQWYYRSQPE